ncbi:MAG TPA: DUF1489 domain-containing protein [Caulobacteraceae bacterium]|nr:DUF1489 domain-containing protein [Caulobacteraceae bacterium]
MVLHLVKLCVGADTPDDLRAWRASRAAPGERPTVHTRQTPRRAAEIVGGGSLYWVFKGVILIRQPVLAIETAGEGAQRRCRVLLEDAMIATAPQPRRAFQGWRYLEAQDAPPDLAELAPDGALPLDLARRLRELGAF